MAEIVTRKDAGGGKKKTSSSAIFKAHMSYYNHMRRMKKKSSSTMLAGDSFTNFNMGLRVTDDGNTSQFNNDLDCVIIEPTKTKKEKSKRGFNFGNSVSPRYVNGPAPGTRSKPNKKSRVVVKKQFNSAMDVTESQSQNN